MPKNSKNQNFFSKTRKWKYTNFIAVVALSTALALTITAVNQRGLTTTSQHAAGRYGYPTPTRRPYGYPTPTRRPYGYPYPKPYGYPYPVPSCNGNGGTCINSRLCRANCTNPPPGRQECGRYNCPSGQSCCF